MEDDHDMPENDFDGWDTQPNRDLLNLHPCIYLAAKEMQTELIRRFKTGETKLRWLVCEAWRSPERQFELYRDELTYHPPWASPHQYGLAVDFAPHPLSADWPHTIDKAETRAIIELAKQHNLHAPAREHCGHFESPLWPEIRKILPLPEYPQFRDLN